MTMTTQRKTTVGHRTLKILHMNKVRTVIARSNDVPGKVLHKLEGVAAFIICCTCQKKTDFFKQSTSEVSAHINLRACLSAHLSTAKIGHFHS